MRRDRKVLGQTNTLLEQGIDFGRLRQDRLAKIQRQMAARDIGALLLTDIMNIRYATGVSIMPLWTAVNLAHYVLVPPKAAPSSLNTARPNFGSSSTGPRFGRPITGSPALPTSSPGSCLISGRPRLETFSGIGVWPGRRWV